MLRRVCESGSQLGGRHGLVVIVRCYLTVATCISLYSTICQAALSLNVSLQLVVVNIITLYIMTDLCRHVRSM